MSRRTNLRGLAIKIKLIQMFGGSCKKCGYDNIKCVAVFDFHHRDPKIKEFGINKAVNAGYAWDDIVTEARKCDLLCCRCHRELENTQPDIDVEALFESFRDRKRKIGSLEGRDGRPTKDELQELVKEHSQSEIGRAYGVSRKTVGYWCMKFGVKLPRVRYKVGQIPSKDKLKELIEEKSASQIGVMFGVSGGSVKKWLDKYELKNPRSEKFYRSTKIDW